MPCAVSMRKISMNDQFIYGLLEGAATTRQNKLLLVQVGANDGVTNDPIVRWINDNIYRTEACFIEPQADVYEVLKSNYAHHPCAQFHNVAVGADGVIKLFRINSKYSHLYRGIIASGITSHNREYVLGKIKKNMDLTEIRDPLVCLEEFTIPCRPLESLISADSRRIDFLQIDAEGYDDQVIYHSSVPRLRPRIINYEFIHLSEAKRASLREFLTARGYKIIRWSNEDECAISLA